MGQNAFITVNVKTKPYIKYYLEKNYGNPVNIDPGSFISKYLISLLSRPVKHDNKSCNTYTSDVVICLNETNFKRYGFGLTKTATKEFNLGVENHIRTLIRQITDNIVFNAEENENWRTRFEQLKKEHNALLKMQSSALNLSNIKKLRKFEALMNARLEDAEKHRVKLIDALQTAAYDLLGFDESILPLETIRKDYYRYKMRQKP